MVVCDCLAKWLVEWGGRGGGLAHLELVLEKVLLIGKLAVHAEQLLLIGGERLQGGRQRRTAGCFL